jgi:hypothetical protein
MTPSTINRIPIQNNAVDTGVPTALDTAHKIIPTTNKIIEPSNPTGELTIFLNNKIY